MVCKDSSDSWTLVGVSCYRDALCTKAVVTRVSAFVDWIQQNYGGPS
jgi:hypothetical protein